MAFRESLFVMCCEAELASTSAISLTVTKSAFSSNWPCRICTSAESALFATFSVRAVTAPTSALPWTVADRAPIASSSAAKPATIAAWLALSARAACKLSIVLGPTSATSSIRTTFVPASCTAAGFANGPSMASEEMEPSGEARTVKETITLPGVTPSIVICAAATPSTAARSFLKSDSNAARAGVPAGIALTSMSSKTSALTPCWLLFPRTCAMLSTSSLSPVTSA